MIVDNPKYHNPRIGYLQWKQYMNAFGYGTDLNIDLPGEDDGNIPDTSGYNKDFGGNRVEQLQHCYFRYRAGPYAGYAFTNGKCYVHHCQ